MNTKKAIAHLKKDPVMRRLIKKYEPPKWDYSKGVFSDLLRSIVNQQLSGKAAATIWTRFTGVVGNSPRIEKIIRVRPATLRKCGLSFAKVSYIKGIARAVKKGEFRPKKLNNLPDEEVLAELIKLKGVGRWTAEMIMMFSLQRPNIFSVGDLGIRTAVARHYRVDRDDWRAIEQVAERWQPYRTIACRYLWRSLGEDE